MEWIIPNILKINSALDRPDFQWSDIIAANFDFKQKNAGNFSGEDASLRSSL